jgi:hypothetical protein
LVVDQQHRNPPALALQQWLPFAKLRCWNSTEISDFDLTTPGHYRKDKPKFDREEENVEDS